MIRFARNPDLEVAFVLTVPVLLLLAASPGPCPHRYFPLEEGLHLTYKAGKSTVRLWVADVKRTEDGIEAELLLERGGKTGKTRATCGPAGVSTALGGLESALLGTSGLDVQVTAAEGVMIPPEAGLTPGAPWQNRLAFRLKAPEKGNLPLGLRPVLTTEFVRRSEVVGPDAVEIAGKSHEALKVKTQTTAGAGSPDAERTVEGHLWLVPGVGIAKMATGDSVDLELVKVERRRAGAAPKAAGAK